MNTGECIKKYVELRDYVKVQNDAHQERMKPYVDGMKAIENALLAEFNALGDVQNIKTEHGTAFKKKWTSVKVADRPTFLGFIYDDFWERSRFLTSAVTKTEVQDFMETHNAVPPGLDVSQGFDINIRRPSE